MRKEKRTIGKRMKNGRGPRNGMPGEKINGLPQGRRHG